MADVRRLTASDAEIYREIRLEGLDRHPEAFGASFDTEATEDIAFFAGRLTGSTVFGGFDGQALLGVAGCFTTTQEKERHKATLFGMYVREAARGKGLGKLLVEAVLKEAGNHAEIIRLTVVTTNAAARDLYERCGFECYGIEPKSLKVAGRYYDEALMYKHLRG
ncbi:MAG: GNAT family N-acetyltransferase [Alphaproteobacteria bacterium]|nr:GNAT family N-acetyltransferase [Alphaproteobacteria bacterium]